MKTHERFERLPQLRIAVNARCGRSCFYCRPSGEAMSTEPAAALSPRYVAFLARLYADFGGRCVKLTGGDPALWEPLADACGQLKRIHHLKELHVISRHPRIGELAGRLSEAGVDLINVSLDTLRPSLHREITAIDDLPAVLDAIHACVRSGVRCQVNCVVMRGVNDDEIDDIVSFCEQAGVNVLKLLDVIRDLDNGAESFVCRLHERRTGTMRDLFMPLDRYANHYRARAIRTSVALQGGLGHPMTVHVLPSGLELVFKNYRAGAWYGSNCQRCRHYPCHDALMAIRVTADLRLQFCLLGDDFSVDLRPYFADSPEAVRRVLFDALQVYDTATFQPTAPEDASRGLS